MMAISPEAWLSRQSDDVRGELDNLLAYKPEPEFIQGLADWLPVVPATGLIDLYYDIFYCCKPVFRIAVRQLHDPEALAQFLLLAERALVDQADFAAYSSAWSGEDEDIEEVVFWLKRQAALNAVSRNAAQ
jgi:hypothetical protein